MSKKSLIFGLFIAVLATSVSGVLAGTNAHADYYPYGVLTCNASVQTVNSGDWASFSAYYTYGSTSSYPLNWSAWTGNPTSGTGAVFSTRFSTSNTNELRTVTVTDGYQTASCSITVNGLYPTYTPMPTPYYGAVAMDHTVRNVTRGTEGTSVTAYNSDRLQFIVRITTANQYASNVYVRDWVPQYVSVLPGTTTVDGVSYADGIATNGLSLGTLVSNRTYVVRFDGILNSSYSTALTNTANVHVDGLADQTRTSTISVIGSSFTPTPTPTPYVNGQSISLKEYGRNVTLGQSTEHASVIGHANDTLDIILHVRASSTTTAYNVYVTDMLPVGLHYIGGSTKVDGIVAADGVTTSGLNIGTLSTNQERIVAFSVRVGASSVPAWGQVDVRNTSQVRADGIATVSVQLPVTLGNALSLAAIAKVKTGPVDSILMSLLASIIVAGLYAMYTNTALFGRRQSLAEIRTSISRGNTVNFVR